MKKNIAYYLEDPERLSEISLHDLNKWVEEMPYSQPLRLLMDLKSDQFVSSLDEDNSRYGTYFAEDYEPLLFKNSIDDVEPDLSKTKADVAPLAEEPNEKVSEVDTKLVADEELATQSIKEDHTKVTDEKLVDSEVSDVSHDPIDIANEETNPVLATEELPVLAHNLVDDTSEDLLEEDLLEVNPNVVVVNEVSHAEADEVLEAELENEILEVSDEDVEELVIVESNAESDLEVESDSVEDKVTEEEGLKETEVKEQYAGLVDYKSYVIGVSDDVNSVPSESAIIKPEATDQDNKSDKKKSTSKSKLIEEKKKKSKDEVKVSTSKKKKQLKVEDKIAAPKKKKRKKNKKSKTEAKLSTTKNKKSKSEKVKSKKKTKKSKASKKKENKTILADDNKGAIKKVEGSIVTESKLKAGKPIKSKAKKIKNKVKYVVVNESATNDFKLKDYDGVSKFTNWLLEQKSINGKNESLINQKTEVVGKKKDKKKKKKNKKSKVLKVAQDSVKKSEMIISEPLANIMATQGHTKKAKKMYKQLGLIFPEKSAYFAAKIENLKKK